MFAMFCSFLKLLTLRFMFLFAILSLKVTRSVQKDQNRNHRGNVCGYDDSKYALSGSGNGISYSRSKMMSVQRTPVLMIFLHRPAVPVYVTRV